MPKGTGWPKGVSGNPKGRPRVGHTMTDILQKFLSLPFSDLKGLTEKPAEFTGKEAVAIKLIGLAVSKGDVGAIRYIYDRIDGSPRQSIEHTGEMRHTGLVIVRSPEGGKGADGDSH